MMLESSKRVSNKFPFPMLQTKRRPAALSVKGKKGGKKVNKSSDSPVHRPPRTHPQMPPSYPAIVRFFFLSIRSSSVVSLIQALHSVSSVSVSSRDLCSRTQRAWSLGDGCSVTRISQTRHSW